jgi:hypothetical protein
VRLHRCFLTARQILERAARDGARPVGPNLDHQPRHDRRLTRRAREAILGARAERF